MSRRLASPACARIFCCCSPAARIRGVSRDVDPKRFPRLVRVLLLPDEAALLKELRDDKERSSSSGSSGRAATRPRARPENEFEDNVLTVWARSDDLFSYPGQKGSETGCGQVLALLGKPEEVVAKGAIRKEAFEGEVPRSGSNAAAAAAPGSGRQFDNMAYLRDGSTREPESWVYRDRPGLPYHVHRRRAEASTSTRSAATPRARAFSATTCAGGRGVRDAAGHRLRARARTGAWCRSPPPAASTGASGGARALLSRRAPTSRWRPSRSCWCARRRARRTWPASSPRRPGACQRAGPAAPLAAQATDASRQGRSRAWRARSTASAQADGSVVASWGLALKPGQATRSASPPRCPTRRARCRAWTSRCRTSAAPRSRRARSSSTPTSQPPPGRPDPRDPFAAFQMGGPAAAPALRQRVHVEGRAAGRRRGLRREDRPRQRARPRSRRATAS